MYKIIELTPKNGQKSFYGKAKVVEEGEIYTLRSYDTEIMSVSLEGNIVSFPYDMFECTNTTLKHIKAFLEEFAWGKYCEIRSKSKITKKDILEYQITNF